MAPTRNGKSCNEKPQMIIFKVVPYQEDCVIGRSKTCPRHDFRHDKRIQYAISEADGMTSLSNEERLGSCQYTIAKKEKLDKSNCKYCSIE